MQNYRILMWIKAWVLRFPVFSWKYCPNSSNIPSLFAQSSPRLSGAGTCTPSWWTPLPISSSRPWKCSSCRRLWSSTRWLCHLTSCRSRCSWWSLPHRTRLKALWMRRYVCWIRWTCRSWSKLSGYNQFPTAQTKLRELRHNHIRWREWGSLCYCSSFTRTALWRCSSSSGDGRRPGPWCNCITLPQLLLGEIRWASIWGVCQVPWIISVGRSEWGSSDTCWAWTSSK